jgi:hypothetical protein
MTEIDSHQTLRTKRGRKSNLRGVIVTNHAIASAFRSYQAAIEILRPDRRIRWAPVKNSETDHPMVQRIRSELGLGGMGGCDRRSLGEGQGQENEEIEEDGGKNGKRARGASL